MTNANAAAYFAALPPDEDAEVVVTGSATCNVASLGIITELDHYGLDENEIENAPLGKIYIMQWWWD